ncbi:2OG-Fe(II) oxygenase [Enterovibrio paralichthyis]|uniref:2OG-Fe(II) oxygenase n=1 Tax=Enterovibrio paralichthyis TaxID=2853805 RepID=UPI001C473161|nr:2OG-Fe(II) oxygenase [Enterovibrio paralichthyis]MBV7297741.1 2OG-Fe(II) oxygenase [Enterovibrio paralichthyis]
MNTEKLLDALHTHGLYIWDDFLNAEEVEQLRAAIPENMKPAGIGREQRHHTNTTIRSDKIIWLERGKHPAIDDFFSRMAVIKNEVNRHFFLGLFEFEAHFARYDIGDFYQKHLDAFEGRSNRRLTVVMYLNEEWADEDGGEIVIYDHQDNHLHTLWPKAGRLLVFLSEEFPHEVLPTHRERYSIAGWFRVNGMRHDIVDPSR